MSTYVPTRTIQRAHMCTSTYVYSRVGLACTYVHVHESVYTYVYTDSQLLSTYGDTPLLTVEYTYGSGNMFICLKYDQIDIILSWNGIH